MKNAIILHGKPLKDEYYSLDYPSASNSQWLPWLQKQLLVLDVEAATPEVPFCFDPEWELWCREVERYTINEETALIGHSCGAGFWAKYLSINPDIKVGKVILVAPWIDPDGDETRGFFSDFSIDRNLVQRTAGVTIFHSDNDMGNVHKSVATLRDNIDGIDYHEFHNYGHFCFEDMGTTAFPELLEAVVSK